MNRKISFLLIVLFVCNFVLHSTTVFASQSFNSIKEELLNSETDSAKIRLLNTIAYKFYWDFEHDSCYKYAYKALILSEKLLDSKMAENNRGYLVLCKEYKAKSLANIARGLKRHDTQAALDTLFKAVELIKQTGNKLEEGRIYESIGSIYDFTGKHEDALENHLLSLNAYREAGANNKMVLQLTNVAVAYRSLGNYGDALEYLVESLKISKEINDSTGMVEALLAMGFTYMYVEKWSDALYAQHQALKIYERMSDSLGIARIYNDMGVTNMNAGNSDIALEQHKKALAIRLKSTDYYYTYASYSYIGEIYESFGNYAEAIKSYKSGLIFARLAGIKLSVIYSHLNTGSAYLKSGDQNRALKQFQLALEISRRAENHTSETLASIKIAEIYLKWNQPGVALTWLQKAEKAAPRSSVSFLADIFYSIAKSYYKLGDYKNAYLNSMIYSQMKDSAVISENLEKITTLINRLEFDNKKKLQDESHIKLMQLKQSEIERQKIVRNFSLFSAFVVLVFAIIFFIRFIEKNKLNTALKETLSNLKSAQVQLIHAEKMASLGELTAGVAHEIQNPLNFVKNFSEVNTDLIEELKQELINGDLSEIKALADDIATNEVKIIEHSKRADSIVKGMLQHSRKGGNEKEPTDLNKLADEFLRLSYHGLKARDKDFNADFKTEFDMSLPKINVIPQEIGRVLLNLIINKFHSVTEKSKNSTNDYKPRVIVITQMNEKNVIIKVKDNGGGIPDKILNKIFQPFFTTKSTGEGTGLGLSLSYDIITNGHGGKLNVETVEGEGSEFILQLPV